MEGRDEDEIADLLNKIWDGLHNADKEPEAIDAERETRREDEVKDEQPKSALNKEAREQLWLELGIRDSFEEAYTSKKECIETSVQTKYEKATYHMPVVGGVGEIAEIKLGREQRIAAASKIFIDLSKRNSRTDDEEKALAIVVFIMSQEYQYAKKHGYTSNDRWLDSRNKEFRAALIKAKEIELRKNSDYCCSVFLRVAWLTTKLRWGEMSCGEKALFAVCVTVVLLTIVALVLASHGAALAAIFSACALSTAESAGLIAGLATVLGLEVVTARIFFWRKAYTSVVCETRDKPAGVERADSQPRSDVEVDPKSGDEDAATNGHK